RWNSRGVAVVYASESKSLAAIETLVHIDPRIRFRYKAFRLEFDDALVERLTPSRLPTGWRSEPVERAIQQFGDAWVREGRSAVLAAPSIIIPEEVNYVLNPAHPDFATIKIGASTDF